MENEVIEIVDSQGKFLKRTTRKLAYKYGFLHKAVNIVIFNRKNQVYLQKRSSNKSAFPLYWDISASEHIKPKESFKKAAIRGLMEELSIDTTIKKVRSKHIQKNTFKKNGVEIIENELVELYIATYNGKIKIDKSEVASGKFVSLLKLKSILKTEKFTPWGIEEIQYILNHKILI